MTAFNKACIKANEEMIAIVRKMSEVHLSCANTGFTAAVGSYD